MKKVLSFFKHPPKWFIAVNFVLTVLFAAASITSLCIGLGNKFYSYILYGFAGLAIGYSIYVLVLIAPSIKQVCIRFLNKFNFTRRFYQSYGFRTTINSCLALLVNILFAIFEFVMSIVLHSFWYAALGMYHLVLSFTRLGIVLRAYKESKRRGAKEHHILRKLKTYRNTGICILLTNLALIAVLIQMMFSFETFNYIGIMIYVVSAYTFWKMTLAIIGIVKAVRYNDYATQSFKNLNMTDALVSLFALQTALIATFGANNSSALHPLNIVSAVIVTALTLAIGLHMIIRGIRQSNKLKRYRDSLPREDV